MTSLSIKLKFLLGLILSLAVLAFVAVGLWQEYQTRKTTAGLDDNLALKASLDRILSVEDYSQGNPNGTVSYTYISTKPNPLFLLTPKNS